MTTKLTDHARFGNLTFSDFKAMATDGLLSCYEKIGFPNSYREGKEELIFQDILTKLTLLQSKNKVVVDIGPGCSELPLKLIELCRKQSHQLFLIDSQEMLDQLPDASFITKIAAFYPRDCKTLISEWKGRVDVLLSYSVLHYIFVETNLFEFMDTSLSLLADGGQFLLGDIPNVSKRKRFLSSPPGIAHHQKHYDPTGLPQVDNFVIEPQQIDDGVLLGMLMRCRAAGFDAYLVPQAMELPMANRREDMLIVKP